MINVTLQHVAFTEIKNKLLISELQQNKHTIEESKHTTSPPLARDWGCGPRDYSQHRWC